MKITSMLLKKHRKVKKQLYDQLTTDLRPLIKRYNDFYENGRKEKPEKYRYIDIQRAIKNREGFPDIEDVG